MPFIERIDVDDLKRILVTHYDAINATHGDTRHDGEATRTSTLHPGEDDQVIEAIEATAVHRRDGDRDPSLSMDELDRQDSSNDVDDDTDEAKEAMKMPDNEEQQSIKLYQTNRNMWRHKMTTTIRQSPNQFAMILKMIKNNDSDDASLTKNEFETAFAALNNSLIECMFEDIGSFEGKGNDEFEERLKLTTIGRWMEFESFLFEEVECVNDQRIIVSLHHELDQYLEYKSDDNGKGAIIQRMKTNEYGKQLDERYGLSKTEWCIVSVNGETVNDKMENEIDYILKQVDLNKGYQLTLVKKGKEDHVQIELAAENISKDEAKEDNVSEQDDGVNELVGFADAYFETDYI